GGAADGRAERDPDPPRVLDLEVEPRVAHRLGGRGERELHVPVGAFGAGRVESAGDRVEVALGGDPRAEPLGVEERDPAGRRAAGGQQVPEARDADAAGGHHTQPGDGHAPVHLSAPVTSSGFAGSAATPSPSVSTWPSSGRGASGPRWKTMRASTPPTL